MMATMKKFGWLCKILSADWVQGVVEFHRSSSDTQENIAPMQGLCRLQPNTPTLGHSCCPLNIPSSLAKGWRQWNMQNVDILE